MARRKLSKLDAVFLIAFLPAVAVMLILAVPFVLIDAWWRARHGLDELARRQ
jgi:hypothetical protein